MAAVARAPRIPIERLTGQPYLDNQRDQQTHRDIDALREALRHHDRPARPLSELTVEVADLTRLQRNADSRKLAARLPALIEELTVAAHQTDPTTGATVYELLVLVLRATHALLLRLGYRDLAESVEHQLALTAQRSGDPLAGGLVHKAAAELEGSRRRHLRPTPRELTSCRRLPSVHRL